jgi:hypothetical protein
MFVVPIVKPVAVAPALRFQVVDLVAKCGCGIYV